MRPKANPTVFFNFYSANKSNQQAKLRPEGITAKAILVPRLSYQKKVEQEPVMEEYEFEILFNEEKRQWSTELQGGNYLINVKAPGHPEHNQIVSVIKGRKEFDIVCSQMEAALVNLKI